MLCVIVVNRNLKFENWLLLRGIQTLCVRIILRNVYIVFFVRTCYVRLLNADCPIAKAISECVYYIVERCVYDDDRCFFLKWIVSKIMPTAQHADEKSGRRRFWPGCKHNNNNNTIYTIERTRKTEQELPRACREFSRIWLCVRMRIACWLHLRRRSPAAQMEWRW